MGQLVVTEFVTLDGVVQDPGGFGEIEHGGWALNYFDEASAQHATEALLVRARNAFRVAYARGECDDD